MFFRKSKWIEIDFWLVFFRFWLTAILAKTTHCCKFKAWQLSCGRECWIVRWLNYTNRIILCDLHGRFKVSCSYPTHPCIIDPISPLPFLCVTQAGDRVHLISTSPSIIGLCAVSDCRRTCYVISALSSLMKASELAESFTRSSLQCIITR